MKITSERLQHFQELYEKHFGTPISTSEADRQLRALLTVTELGLQPRPPN